MEALQRYVSRAYPLDAAVLETLFKEMRQSVVAEPEALRGKVLMKEGKPEVTEWKNGRI